MDAVSWEATRAARRFSIERTFPPVVRNNGPLLSASIRLYPDQETRAQRQPAFLSGVNAISTNMRTFGAAPTESGSRDTPNERVEKIPERVCRGPHSQTRTSKEIDSGATLGLPASQSTAAAPGLMIPPLGPSGRDSDRSQNRSRRGDSYVPGPDPGYPRTTSARSSSSMRDPPPHREASIVKLELFRSEADFCTPPYRPG